MDDSIFVTSSLCQNVSVWKRSHSNWELVRKVLGPTRRRVFKITEADMQNWWAGTFQSTSQRRNESFCDKWCGGLIAVSLARRWKQWRTHFTGHQGGSKRVTLEMGLSQFLLLHRCQEALIRKFHRRCKSRWNCDLWKQNQAMLPKNLLWKIDGITHHRRKRKIL